MTPKRIIWHHTADSSTGDQFAKVDAYHKTRDFPKSSFGYFVGYHYLIETSGLVRQARKDDEIGAHDSGENFNSIGICFAGNFNITTPTEAQIASAVKVLAAIRARWDIPLARIEPHRWDDDTDCPGSLLPDNWLVKQYLKREGNTLLELFLWVGEKAKLL